MNQGLIQIAMCRVPDTHELDARWRELIAGMGDMAV
jgi:hypothetical protein